MALVTEVSYKSKGNNLNKVLTAAIFMAVTSSAMGSDFKTHPRWWHGQGQVQKQATVSVNKNDNLNYNRNDNKNLNKNTNLNSNTSTSTSSSTADASNSGVSNSTSVTTERSAPSVAVGSIYPTATCQAGMGVGGSGVSGSGLINFSWTKKECSTVVLAQNFMAIGMPETSCELLKTTASWKRAMKDNPQMKAACDSPKAVK